MSRARATSFHGPSYLRRSVAKREPRQRFLIVCEGKETEPNYFRGFRVPGSVMEMDIRGLGLNTVDLVRDADELAKIDGEYDQVWCVFDRDGFPAQHFADALKLAKRLKIRVAYSNESFELWFLLHFNYVCTGISRTLYCSKLSSLIRAKYRKNSREMYALLEPQQPQAIRNAKTLMGQYCPPDPVSDNPSTSVHLLVEELNRFIR